MNYNVIFLHLESVSRASLWQYRHEQGTLWRLMSRALQFDHFYTASTSTNMTMTDVIYGDSSINDCCYAHKALKSMVNLGVFNDVTSHFILNGYKPHFFLSSPYSRQVENVSDESGVYLNQALMPAMCDKALGYLNQSHREGRPFFAYFWDDTAHLAYVSPEKEAAASIPEKFQRAYALIDFSLNRLLTGLAESGLWERTIIVGFGDHGDEPWSHGFHRGYCHSLPPYASLTWTPMFIYWPDQFQPGVNSQVVSSVDLKKTVLSLVFPGQTPVEEVSRSAGIDIFKEKRSFAFSQNLYALQQEYSDPERGLIKGYAVTDGNYRLVVSSGGCDKAAGGMALYCDQVDPSNSFNLLDLFLVDRDGEIKKFSPPPGIVAKHFICSFGESQVESIVEAYSRLKPALQAHIREKEESAIAERERIFSLSARELADAYCADFARLRRVESDPGYYTGVFEKIKGGFADTVAHTFPEYPFLQIWKAK